VVWDFAEKGLGPSWTMLPAARTGSPPPTLGTAPSGSREIDMGKLIMELTVLRTVLGKDAPVASKDELIDMPLLVDFLEMARTGIVEVVDSLTGLTWKSKEAPVFAEEKTELSQWRSPALTSGPSGPPTCA
jgi:hypothetical protein